MGPSMSVCLSLSFKELGNSHVPGSLLEYVVATLVTEVIIGPYCCSKSVLYPSHITVFLAVIGFTLSEVQTHCASSISGDGVGKCKCLGVLFNNKGNSSEEIYDRVNKRGNIVRSLNSILWVKSLRRITKETMCKERNYKIMVQSVAVNGGGNVGCRKNRNTRLPTEMDHLGRRTRLDRIRNETIREIMEMEKDITDGMQKRQLIRFRHTNRMRRQDVQGMY
jgi:hypothetical protein